MTCRISSAAWKYRHFRGSTCSTASDRCGRPGCAPREIGFRIDRGRFGLTADYALLDEQETAQSYGDREQIDLNARFRLNENWTVTGNLVQDLSDGSSETLSAKTGPLSG